MRTLGSRVAAAAVAVLLSRSLIAQTPAQVFDTGTGQKIKVTEVAGGLVHPYSLAFPDARTMLIAERHGKLRVVKDGVLQPKSAFEMPAPGPGAPATAASETLHFITLHPAFAQNHRIYLSYPKYGAKGTSTMAVGFGTWSGDELRDFKEIFAAEAWGTFGANPG